MFTSIFNKLANQVFAIALLEGPKQSWDLRRAFYGEAYAKASKNNAAYNRSRGIALAEGVIIRDGQRYAIGLVGMEIISYAKEHAVDLTKVKTAARHNYELLHPEA